MKTVSSVRGGVRAESARQPGVAEQKFFSEVDRLVPECIDRVISWRREIHAHPELGNREVCTAALVARHLSACGLEVRTGIAHTGVVGTLRGALPGPVVALRADMDALPVAEEVDLAFASSVRTSFNGRDVGVMHACGHDCHTAVLMGVAQLLSSMRAQLPGIVKFIFQPAEEGAPEGEEGGAKLMIKEGVLDTAPRPEVIFGLHVASLLHTGTLGYGWGAVMAGSDEIAIRVQGRQTHAALPWLGADPIVGAAQVIVGLQSVISRQTDIVTQPAVLSLSTINGGIRENIIPDSVEMRGTIRTFDETLRHQLHERVRNAAAHFARGCQCEATVDIASKYPVTVNPEPLSTWSAHRLAWAAGEQNVTTVGKLGNSEDFSFYQQRIPGFFYFVGITPKTQDTKTAPANHSPRFYVDEAGLSLAVRSLAYLAVSYLTTPSMLPA